MNALANDNPERLVMNTTNSTLFVYTKSVILRNLLFGIVGVIGNVLATVFLLVNRRVKLSLRITLIGLTLNDLCFAMNVTMFGNAGWSWRSDDYYCWPVMYVALSSIVTSHVMTCLLALHNYVAVFNPLRCNQIITGSRSALAVLGAWLLGYSTALVSSGIRCPKGLQCLLIAIIPRRGLVLACSICLICSSVIIGINITICWKLRNRRKVMNMGITHPSGLKLAPGSGTLDSSMPTGITYKTNKGTNSSSHITTHFVPSTDSTSISLPNTNTTLSRDKELDKNTNVTLCTHSNNDCYVHGSHLHVEKFMNEQSQTQGTSSQLSDESKLSGSNRENIYETHDIIFSAHHGISACTTFTQEAVQLNSDTDSSGHMAITAEPTMCSLRFTEDIDSKETIQQFCSGSPTNLLVRTSYKNPLNKTTLVRNIGIDKIQTPCLPHHSSVFTCHSTLSQLITKHQIDYCPTIQDESHLHTQQCRTTGRIACTSNTLVMLTLWSCLLTLPLIIYATYATIWTSDLQKFSTSSFGILVSSVCCAHSFANPLLYAWRFTAWRNVRFRTRLCLFCRTCLYPFFLVL